MVILSHKLQLLFGEFNINKLIQKFLQCLCYRIYFFNYITTVNQFTYILANWCIFFTQHDRVFSNFIDKYTDRPVYRKLVKNLEKSVSYQVTSSKLKNFCRLRILRRLLQELLTQFSFSKNLTFFGLLKFPDLFRTSRFILISISS